MVLTLTAIAAYIGDKFLAQYIKDQIWVKRVWYNLSPPKKFKNELVRAIYKTINEFSKSKPVVDNHGDYPFYKSQVFLDHLSNYVFFGSNNLSEIKIDFSNFPQCIPPSNAELEEFYELFYNNLRSNKKLKDLYIDENYKSKIFTLSDAINEIRKTTDEIKKDTSAIKKTVNELLNESNKNKLSIEIIISSLKTQTKRQIEKQINSGKYIKDTFIELGEQKEQIRYLSDSILYSEKVFEEIKRLDFRYLNILLNREKHENFIFDFDFVNPSNITEANEILSKAQAYLSGKKLETESFEKISYNIRSFDLKIRDSEDDLQSLISSVSIITESAGQGKTNFLCDFADNFLNKREIPYVFLTGTELDANDIRKSVLKKIFPNNDTYIFQDFIDILQSYCYEKRKHFIIIIDGINENTNARLLSEKLEEFLSEILEYDFIKVIISCRTEYYQQNFENLEKSNFKDKLILINSLFAHRYHNEDDTLQDKLLYTYFDHFQISFNNNISNDAKNQLTSNLLLLRIFCEVHQKEKFTTINHIYKNKLFEAYYNIKLDEINKRLNLDEFNIGGKLNIKRFIIDIVKYMINNQQYANIPLDEIIAGNENRGVYIRFLDENILVKRDLPNTEIYSTSELVNFTFDEFRDFLISKYLIENLYENSDTKFEEFINSELVPNSPILEGCGTFLFFISKSKKDVKLNSLIENQQWYDNIFQLRIFDVPDDEITETDQLRIKGLLLSSNNRNEIILDLILRYNLDNYKNLNIKFLVEMLQKFSTKEYEAFSSSFGRNTHNVRKIDQESLCEQLGNILEDGDFDEKKHFHNLFEILIYMFLNSHTSQIRDLYESYYYKYSDKAKEHLKNALESSNSHLVDSINEFISNYEISI